jgi:predicted GIY-YIG superfamily endonuclease
MKQFLYRHFNKDGILLYVGISVSVPRRIREHKDNSHWFEQIANITIETFQTREEVIQKEKEAIAKENPLWNIQRPNISGEIKKQEVFCNIDKKYESKNEIVSRIVSFGASYSLEEIAESIGFKLKDVEKAIEEKKLGYYVVPPKSTMPYKNKHGEVYYLKAKKRVTGWQFVDFLEYLEAESVETISYI